MANSTLPIYPNPVGVETLVDATNIARLWALEFELSTVYIYHSELSGSLEVSFDATPTAIDLTLYKAIKFDSTVAALPITVTEA